MSNARVTLDLADTGSTMQEPLEKGWYEAVIYDATDKTTGPNSKNPGSPYIAAQVNITQEGEGYGRKVFDNFIGKYVTENAPGLANKAKQLARITEVWDGESPEVVLPDAEDVTGIDVEVLLRIERDTFAEEQYEEENGDAPDEPIYRNTVSAYRPVGGWPRPGGKSTGKAAAGRKKKTITV